MKQHDPSYTLSVRLIEWLKQQGKSQKDVAVLLGVSESFISRVASGHRSLTVDHLAELEDRLKLPLPVLLLESELVRQKSPEKRAVLTEALSLLRDSHALRTELGTETQQPATLPSTGDKPKKKRKQESLIA
jgi:transcriptional regulator with XRE-family HTH domain